MGPLLCAALQHPLDPVEDTLQKYDKLINKRSFKRSKSAYEQASEHLFGKSEEEEELERQISAHLSSQKFGKGRLGGQRLTIRKEKEDLYVASFWVENADLFFEGQAIMDTGSSLNLIKGKSNSWPREKSWDI